MKVHLMTIGDEILIGQIVDTNSAWMAQQLNLEGIRISGGSSVGDVSSQIIRGLQLALEDADAVLITGGLGPTKDDITKKALAQFFGVDMQFHQGTFDRIQRLFERFNRPLSSSHREQCYMPANAILLPNRMGTAPGMWFEYGTKVVVSMPGVPYEMQAIMQDEVVPRLKARFALQPIAHRTIQTIGEGETTIADRIADIEDSLPPHIKLAYLPNLGRVRLRLTGVSKDKDKLDVELDQYTRRIQARIPEWIFGYGEVKIEAAVGQLLKDRGLFLGTAESCTGGYLSHLITSIPGSSAYYKGSVIAYSNQVKMNQLAVKPQTLEQYGAVSEQTVREMVVGLIPLLQVDLAVAISGIAGPDGGSDEKPVGTIWLAVGNKNQVFTRKILAGKDRLKNIEIAAIAALNLIRKFLLSQLE
ncbi:MAG TPA: CinA family nicotinamide mononucleotide deamidase-related protein [Saprospiraceae bacterium]|nr:CinA family nicotinamide mononucleotide deamidase-related protein [Saprospiraceae bacterium]HMQ83085.1 CinA family nicotinamide mononucleotide deamidase-related protein [Saprospiraceae bacterium]